ncbi:retropepsin-like aspartic protease [Asaia astilbis]|uniref:retropepsin-like aspartic protease n=1 Tax=Asaia astilbis TaxID=610244 RepID=UPI000684203D|nr:retropepsin-like aspartic protease [Asaia astilbis]
MLRPALALLTMIVAGAFPSAAIADPCFPERIAVLPLHNDGLFLNAPVVLDGRQARFILDTGSEGSLITPEAATALHLTPDRLMPLSFRAPMGAGSSLRIC